MSRPPRGAGPAAPRALPAHLLLLAIGTVTLAGCSGSGNTNTRAGGSAEAQLRRELVEWKQRAVMGEVEVERLRDKVERLERELAAARTAPSSRNPSAGADRRGPGRAADVESPGLRDDVGGSGPAEVEEIELEEPSASATVVPPPSAAPAGDGQADPDGAGAEGQDGEGATAQALYDRGYALFHNKRYAEAEAAFRRVLEAHPTSPLADNAQFWIGECRFARGDFSSALDAYSATVERFPSGNKVPDAMLKAGRCLEALGQMREAADIYREILSRFAETVVADQASERLSRLGL